MSVFEGYAHYYDLLYRDKDYSEETLFIQSLLQEHAPRAKAVLELGCGTGGHAECLVKGGFTVHGIDRSHEMLERAERRKSGLVSSGEGLSFSHGDVRTVRMQKKYDVVLSLFHVVSYQTTNDDLQAMFETAREHLVDGGIFLFDCWYGPGVLTERPEYREKSLSDEVVDVLRLCEPVMLPNYNRVDVNYRVKITDRASATTEEICETHSMRYLFMPEIEELGKRNKMKQLFACEWLSGKPPGFETWSTCFGLIAC